MIAQTPTALTLPSRTAHATPCPAIVPPGEIAPRFTVDGGQALEAHLARTCAKIAAGVRGLVPPGRLEALLLGGGYGRGEGGVLTTPGGDRPYNDLEFYVCIRGSRLVNEQRFGRALHVLGEILTPQAGIEVEFKITSLRELARADVSMFSYDLVSGHRWLVGNPELLARCAHHREGDQIPMSEATRLLMNRGSGLLFARERLEKSEFTPADADFVRRNVAKAELALGDAVLVAHGLYHWSVRERHRRLERLARTARPPWIDAVRRHHVAGVDFKLYPERSVAPRDALQASHAAVTALAAQIWLWLEGQRLHQEFPSARAYAASRRDKCPGTAGPRNTLLHLRALGLRPLFAARAGRHPRERIFHALALLLWEPEALAAPTLRARLQHELQTDATTFPEMLRAYRTLWSRVN